MDRIEMLNLFAEDHSLRDQIAQAIDSVVRRGDFINGLDVGSFQKELADYLSVPHIIACGNGTDALQLCLMALDLPAGGEIITPAFSYAATVEVMLLLGFTPVYVDVDPNTYNIDPENIRSAITEKTCAIMPVHLYGQCADMNAVLSIADKHGLKVIEDSAQAVGSGMHIEGKGWMAAGTIGDMGGFSFFPSKNLGCYGDGGAIATRNSDLAQYVRALANHGQSSRYTHDFVGINSRLDTLQAAILRVKLGELRIKTERRQAIAAMYDHGLAGNNKIRIPQRSAGIDHVYHQYTLRSVGADRDTIVNELNKNNISARIYYPTPLPLQPAYRNKPGTHNAQSGENQFPVAQMLAGSVFSIPVHPALKDDEVAFIIETINKICSDK